MPVRAIRGAITTEIDGAPEICRATGELLARMLEANELRTADVISLWLTVTPDLRSEFPARGARDVGWGDVPMLCAVEMDVPGALPRCIRAMAHVDVADDRRLTPVYLGRARELRPDQSR
ncbi:MAG: chorismate mutase [Gemmatimonadaceae bacterium]